MARAGTDWLGVLLAVGCLLMGVLIYTAWTRAPFENVQLSLAGEKPAPPAALSTWAMPPADFFAPVVERPLFTEGRRPAQPETAPAAVAREERPLAVAVTAVILAPERRLAVVETASGKSEVLSLGDEINGWRLVEIGAEHLVFDGGSGVKRVALKDLPAKDLPAAGTAASDPAAVAQERSAPPPEALATRVTIDGRQIEILPEHLGNRGEGSIFAAVPGFESESNNP